MPRDYDNNRRFALWNNDDPKGDKSPHFTGTLEINGVQYWVNMWENKNARGKEPLFSGTIKEKEQGRGSRDDRGRDDRGSNRRDDNRGGRNRDY